MSKIYALTNKNTIQETSPFVRIKKIGFLKVESSYK